MAVLSSNRIAWTYTDDSGNAWRVAALKAWTDQNKLGGAAAAATVPERKGGSPMRRCVVSDGAGHSRTVPVYDAAGAAIATPGTSFNYNANVAGVITQVTGTSSGRVLPEGRRPNVTKQST